MTAERNGRTKRMQAGGSNGICRVIDAHSSPSPDPKRQALLALRVNEQIQAFLQLLDNPAPPPVRDLKS